VSSTYRRQRLADAQADCAGRGGLQDLQGLVQGERVQLGLVDRDQLVSGEQSAVALREAAGDQRPDHHHASTGIQRVLERKRRGTPSH